MWWSLVEITDEVEFPEQRNSTLTPSFEKLVTTSLGNSRKTSSRLRLEPSNAVPEYSSSHGDNQRPWKTTVPSMSFNAPDGNLSAITRLPEPKDVLQRSESESKASTAGDTRKTSHLPEVGQSEANTRSVTVEPAASMLESFQTRTDAVPVSSDVLGFNYYQNRESKLIFSSVAWLERHWQWADPAFKR